MLPLCLLLPYKFYFLFFYYKNRFWCFLSFDIHKVLVCGHFWDNFIVNKRTLSGTRADIFFFYNLVTENAVTSSFFFSFFRSDLFSFLQEFSFASIINPHTEAGLILLSLFRSSLRHFSTSSLLRFIASLLQRCVASSLYYCIVASLLQHYVASSPCYCIVASSLQHCVASSPCNPYLFATAWLTYPSVAVLLHDSHFTIVWGVYLHYLDTRTWHH